MIKTFRDENTKAVAQGRSITAFVNIETAAARRLGLLHAATSLEDLRAVRGNRFQALKGDRKGQFSIRINDQYRICFNWKGTDAFEVEIVDYH